MRQCEFKKRYDPDMDTHVRKHIHGEGIVDIFKSATKAVGKKLFGKTANSAMKSIAKTAAKKAATTAATKTGEYAGNKAGDKIIELLSRKKKTSGGPPASIPSPIISLPNNEITTQEVNDRVNRILSGGRLRRTPFYLM